VGKLAALPRASRDRRTANEKAIYINVSNLRIQLVTEKDISLPHWLLFCSITKIIYFCKLEEWVQNNCLNTYNEAFVMWCIDNLEESNDDLVKSNTGFYSRQFKCWGALHRYYVVRFWWRTILHELCWGAE